MWADRPRAVILFGTRCESNDHAGRNPNSPGHQCHRGSELLAVTLAILQELRQIA